MSSSNDEKKAGPAPNHQEAYAVGNKKPPKHSRFKPLQSGNPKGRPRGSVNLRTRVTQQLRKVVTVTKNGKATKMIKADLIALQVVDLASKGDLKAAMYALRLDDEAAAAIEVSRADETRRQPDKENLRFIMGRIRDLIKEEE